MTCSCSVTIIRCTQPSSVVAFARIGCPCAAACFARSSTASARTSGLVNGVVSPPTVIFAGALRWISASGHFGVLLSSSTVLGKGASLSGWVRGWSGPVPPQDGVPVGAGQRDHVDGDAHPGGFEDVGRSADQPEVDGDVAGEPDEVAGDAGGVRDARAGALRSGVPAGAGVAAPDEDVVGQPGTVEPDEPPAGVVGPTAAGVTDAGFTAGAETPAPHVQAAEF